MAALAVSLCQARGEKDKQNSLSSRIRIQISRVALLPDAAAANELIRKLHIRPEREADWRATNAVQEAAVCAVAGCLCVACAVRALRLVVTPGRRIMWRAVD